MTSINTAANYSGYYSLSGQNSSTGTSSSSSATSSLLSELSGSAAATTSNDAYLLDLSPSAQQYLSSAQSSSSTTSGSFTLTSKQQQALTDILAKYKDAPYTQDTFNKIQDDLNAAGLGTNTLSMQDQTKSFNPTLVLIDALNGSTDPMANSGYQTSSDEQAKSGNYIQQVIKQWQSTSSTYSAQSGDAVSAVSSSGGA